MAQPFIQASFNSGEWAPHLWARTDLDKYHSGAALLENFFVDYRGGASSRSGTRYILRAYKDGTAIRLIKFQAAINVGYALEFGDSYVRFHRNGAPVLESGLNITGATNANPVVLTVTNTYNTGDVDWIYVSGVGGMTELNGKYFIVHAATGTTVTLYDLFGNPVNGTGFGTYTSGGTTQRIYTIDSPYNASDLATLKFTQNIDVMILTHPNHPPYALTFISDASWTLAAITFGSTASPPTTGGYITTNLNNGDVYYTYVVTSVDGNEQESGPSTWIEQWGKEDFRLVPGSMVIHWDAVPGAVRYYVYRAILSYNSPTPTGSTFGYVGMATGTTFVDTNIEADFSVVPPTPQNPFATSGSGVSAVTVTTQGSYTTEPTATFSAPPSGTTATGIPLLTAISISSIDTAGSGYAVGDVLFFDDGLTVTIDNVDGTGAITAASISVGGSTQTLPTNPVTPNTTSGSGTGATLSFSWGVYDILVTNGGSGYATAPTITFSTGAAAATATLGATSAGNPSVCAFFQQRLVFGGPLSQPETLYFSQPGSYYNFDTTVPAQANNAITAPIVTGELANIKAMVPQSGGLIVFTDGISYLINGGGLGVPIAPDAINATSQAYLGANDMPPIVVNYDILHVQSKGSSVRDSTYNFYVNVFAGNDISILSSHLFFGYQLKEWAWAEEPYKIVWAVRSDGAMLSLTFIKEQEFVAWAHHFTEGGAASFKSVCSVAEAASVGYQNFTYVAVARTINSVNVQYIEYFPERPVSTDPQDYWTVDCAIKYSGSPSTTFSGGEYLAGKTVTGLADGVPITPFTMPVDGNFTLPAAASNVSIGLAFTCNLQTLYIDLGQPTVQSKQKKINGVALRVTQTLGLSIGSDASNLVAMKDLVLGNVGRMTNQLVTGLVTGDAFTYVDPKWQEQGQIYVRQDQPYPVSILGFIPQVAVGDTTK